MARRGGQSAPKETHGQKAHREEQNVCGALVLLCNARCVTWDARRDIEERAAIGWESFDAASTNAHCMCCGLLDDYPCMLWSIYRGAVRCAANSARGFDKAVAEAKRRGLGGTCH